MTTWTDKTIEKALRDAKASGTDVWKTDDEKARGVGRLRLRASASGRAGFYFRYVCEGGQRQIPLGVYDSSGKAGLTLKDATAKAGELSKLYQDGHHDLHAYLAQQQAEEQACIAVAAREREKAEREASAGSLAALLDAYVGHLKEQGKQSAQDVHGIFRRNVMTASPDIAAKPAREVTHQEVNAMLVRLIKKGNERAAGKLRSYLNAAYVLALKAQTETNPKLTNPDLMVFNLIENPVAKIDALKVHERDRNLNESELREFLKILEKKTGVVADAILLLLLLGGQRVAQMLRVTPAKVDLGGHVITLLDPKGKGRSMSNPRVHLVPLTDRAAEIVARQLARKVNDKPLPFLFSTDGKVPLRPETLSKLVAEISADMVEAGTASEPFQLNDLRRTCETTLAKLKVSMDVRAHLLSHGLSGVQHKNYDKHTYWDEKRQALELWDAHLKSITNDEELPANVVPMRRKV